MRKAEHNDLIRLSHVRDAAEKALAFIEGKTRESLDEDDLLVFGLMRAFTIIGEAASNITDSFQAAHPEIPWALMIGMRHRIVHAYFDVDLDIVWDTVTENLPSLLKVVEPILSTDNE